MMLKNKIEKLIATFAFDKIRKLNKNNDVIRKLRFISSVIIETRSLHQFDAKVMNVEEIDKEISAHFFVVFAD
jgi:hypothetical protein